MDLSRAVGGVVMGPQEKGSEGLSEHCRVSVTRSRHQCQLKWFGHARERGGHELESMVENSHRDGKSLSGKQPLYIVSVVILVFR